MPKINIIKFDDENDDNQSLSFPENDMLVTEDVLSKSIKPNISEDRLVRRPRPVKRKRKSNFKKFLYSLSITLLFCFIFIFGVFYAYDYIFSPDNPNIKLFNNDNSRYTDTNQPGISSKDQYNFAFFGVDNESPVNARTDFMIIGSYTKSTNKLKIMSIPRDTLTIMPPERIEFLKENNIPILFRSSGKMKLTEVNHHATDEYGTSFLLAQLEEMFKVDFDFYAKFNIDGFKFLVDEIGGVNFYVPQRMYYRDPAQNLYIDLYEGQQTLNGNQAEGVVRYRKADLNNPISEGYPLGDIDRIKVQNDFITAFIKELSDLKNITSTLPALLQTASKYCETDFKLTELPSFLPFLTNFSSDNIEIYSMPYSFEGDFVIPVSPDIENVIDEIFYPSEIKDAVSSKGLEIEVLNGTYTSGIATTVSEKLEHNGFKVSSIGDSSDKETQTKIYVKDRSYGEDLKPFFNSPKIVNDPTLNVDIKIVVGLDDD